MWHKLFRGVGASENLIPQGIKSEFISNLSKQSAFFKIFERFFNSNCAAFTHAKDSAHARVSVNKRQVAFTLAEVLITLGVIGIVAAMTLPALIQRQQEKATVTALKKFYSVMSQAYQFATEEYGPIENWGLKGSLDVDMKDDYATYQNSGEIYLDRFAPYLKIVRRCKRNESNCFAPVEYKTLKGTLYLDMTTNTLGGAVMADGMVLSLEPFSENCTRSMGNSKALANTCGSIFVDINGDKNPNVLGRDMFSFYITKYGIVPRGTSLETDKFSFDKSCKNAKTQDGYACAAWVIYNENLDYLHCSDLGWNTKSKCK